MSDRRAGWTGDEEHSTGQPAKSASAVKLIAELDRRLNLMQRHCWLGQLQYRMWHRLNDMFGSTPDVGDLAPTFFISTADAHLTSAVLILNRLIDRRPDTVSVKQFLKRARAATNVAGVFKLPGEVRAAADADLNRLDSMDVITKIRTHRDKQFVHLGKGLLEPPYGVVSAKDSFEYDDVQAVLVIIGEMLNRYAGFLQNTEFVMQVTGENDVEKLVDLLSTHVNRRRQRPPDHPNSAGDAPPAR